MIKEIKDKKYLSKGKRSLVYTGFYKKQKVTIKKKNPKSEAISRMENEASFLKKLNKYNIGPKLIDSGKDYLVYKYVEGILFIDYIKKNKKIFPIIKDILNQCRVMDKLKINKLEFTRPIKHVFIKNKKATIIDFERCYTTETPKNVTQFCQFLMKDELKEHFKINKKEFIKILKIYKDKQTEKNYKKILEYLKEKTISSSV